MRRRKLGLCVVAALGLGCPETYGVGGVIDEAVEKDMEALAKPPDDYVCPSPEEVQRRCVDPDSETCPRKCR
jgi:hypothetical protein